ncbi:MAG: hypothetical protein Q4G07_02155 [Oscillospiraceae bacterium]|nr:hypothetical protein [Oscillospiraceae bacterium]
MKHLDKIVSIVAKVLEVLHWLGSAAGAVLFVISFINPLGLTQWLNAAQTFTCYGIEINTMVNGSVHMGAVRTAFIGFLLVFALMAMVFRNLYLIAKTARGKTWFSEGETPFQHNIVRMVREIGIFLISIPAVGLVVAAITRLCFGIEMVNDLSGLLIGLVMLYLSQIFARGTQLQNDVDGLL